VKVALFCGGRGSATTIQELLRWPNVQLTLILNAYDDGLSTGILRGVIPGMLGPSDFRKNLSRLLDLYSPGQYALKNLLEYRLPKGLGKHEIQGFVDFIECGKGETTIPALRRVLEQLNPQLRTRVHELLGCFLDYLRESGKSFDYSDCSVGNLIFAGAYLEQDRSFNAAALEMSRLAGSRSRMVNVSAGENRILVGLKEDGSLLRSEAEVVGPQSSVAIRRIFLVESPILESDWQAIAEGRVEEKEEWLRSREALPTISPEAEAALEQADVIVFGPGTQHSSLMPSYRIAAQALRQSPTPVKAFVVNLEPDLDIQGLTASDIVDRALDYAGDPENQAPVITHILLNGAMSGGGIKPGELARSDRYKRALVVEGEFAHGYLKRVHNGPAIVWEILSTWDESVSGSRTRSIDVFVDLDKRSEGLDSVVGEFLEMEWGKTFSSIRLALNKVPVEPVSVPDLLQIETCQYEGLFPEIGYFMDWLKDGRSEYLVLWTGDGEYRFRDVLLSIQLLEHSMLGAVYGSRTQSRRQFRASIHAAYGENRLFHILSLLLAFLLSALFFVRLRVMFSDPLTGFRIFRRRRIGHLAQDIVRVPTPIELTKHLIRRRVEIAELPVNYRTFVGFTDPIRRIRRGMKNLLSLLT